MLKDTINDNNPNYLQFMKMRPPRPIPSEHSKIGDKLDSFSNLLGLTTSLYRVISDSWLFADLNQENIGDAGIIVHLDLLSILQILQEVTEQEYKNLKIHLMEELEKTGGSNE